MFHLRQHPAAPRDYGVSGFARLKGDVPGPSAEERELTSTQTEILREQLSIARENKGLQNLLANLYLSTAGFNVTRDEDGNITDISPGEGFERGQDIQKLFEQRTLAALKGDLPLNPALERSLGQQRDTRIEALRKQLGPGFETSTPGIESLRSLDESQEAVREGARRGDLTLGEQLSLSSQGGNQSSLNQLAIGGQFPLQSISALGGVGTGFGNLSSRFQSDRFAQAQASAQGQASLNQLIGSGLGAAGALLPFAAFI